MAFTLTDRLPTDAGSQKFAGPVDQATGRFMVPAGAGKTTLSAVDYGFFAYLGGWRSESVFSAASVTHTALLHGAADSTSLAVDARGFSKCTAFAAITDCTGTVAVTAIPRLSQTGDNFSPAVSVSATLATGSTIATFDLAFPYFMLGATAATGCSAVVTIDLYLYR